MRKMKKKITTAIKNNFDLLKEANKRISELEETIVLNTCREITKPYCPMRIADLDQIKENKKQIDVLKLNQTDGTPNQNFVAIHILKNGFTQIGLKIENRFDKIEVILRELHELMRSLVSDLQDSNSLSKATIKCYEGKLIKNLEKLDSKKEYKYFDFDTKEYSWGKYYDLGIIKSKNGNLHDYTPSQFVKDYAKTHTLFSLHGVMFSEPKEKATEPEKLDNDPCGIEGKYEHWNREELENECNVLIENMDALQELHLKEKGELIEAFLSKKILIPFIAKIIEKETNEEYCSSETIAELIHDKLKEKWEGTLN